MMKKLLENNGSNITYKSFLVLKLQFLLIIVLLVALLRDFLGFVFWGVEVLIAIYYLYVLLFELRKEEKKSFREYAVFFGVMLLLVEVLWVIIATVKAESLLRWFFYVLIGIIVFMIFFRVALGRDFFYGKVLLSDAEWVVVESDFDLGSFTKPGRYVAENRGKNFRKGEEVKVKVSKGFFGAKKMRVE